MNQKLDWMNDKKLAGIPKVKLEFLQKMFFESKDLTEKERLPFLLALAAKSKREKITFEEEETKLIINVLKEHVSEEEVKKIDTFIKMILERKK